MPVLSERAQSFTESVIREMTRRNLALHGPERAINFAQGFPDFPPPGEIVAAAQAALAGEFHQYSTTWGAPQLRAAVAAKLSERWGREIDPDSEVTVACGATESMIAAVLATVNPGEEVIVFEPYYENYAPDCILSGAVPRYIALAPPQWEFDAGELREAFGPKTRAIIVNTPHNPTGKVFSAAELALIASLAQEHDAVVITDEIYEHLVYEGEHVSMATLPGMAERTITISGASKTYSVTGWRIGWLVAAPHLTGGIRKVHDFLTVGAPHPLQIAVATALQFPATFYEALLSEYRERRDLMVSGLGQLGYSVSPPAGAYYVMAGIDRFRTDDVAFSQRLIEAAAVATVPGSSFYKDPGQGRGHVRFSFPKQLPTIERGLEALQRMGLTA